MGLFGDIAKTGLDLGKTIYGASLRKKGEAQMNSALDNIKYTRPDEYEDIMGILKGRVSSVGTRREMAEESVRAQTASASTGISQLADSPLAALGAYSGLKQREEQAIRDLGIQYEGIRDKAVMGVAGGLEMGAGYSEKEQYYNDMYKNMVKANMGAGKMSAGTNMMFGGMESIGADIYSLEDQIKGSTA